MCLGRNLVSNPKDIHPADLWKSDLCPGPSPTPTFLDATRSLSKHSPVVMVRGYKFGRAEHPFPGDGIGVAQLYSPRHCEPPASAFRFYDRPFFTKPRYVRDDFHRKIREIAFRRSRLRSFISLPCGPIGDFAGSATEIPSLW